MSTITPSRTFHPMKRLFLALLFLFMTSSQAWSMTITVSTISTDPVDELRVFKPFADYLAHTLSESGSDIDKVDVKIAGSVPQVVNWLKRGKIDLFIDSSITALQVNKLSGSQYMLRRWKKGRGEYRSVIFTRADSTISNLGDLKGQVIAFEEPFSTSGFMLPAIQFGLQGIELESVNSPRDLPSPNVVGTIMAYDNETQVTWVERDMVAAAAISEGDFSDFEKTALEPLRIVQFTEYVPYHVVSQRADLDAELADQIKGTLKRVHETEQGRKMLMEFERPSKFDDIPPKLLSNTLKFEPHLTSLLPVN